jgi:hypothetical protein
LSYTIKPLLGYKCLTAVEEIISLKVKKNGVAWWAIRVVMLLMLG